MIIALFPILCPLLSPCRLQKEQSTEGKEDQPNDTKRNSSQEEENHIHKRGKKYKKYSTRIQLPQHKMKISMSNLSSQFNTVASHLLVKRFHCLMKSPSQAGSHEGLLDNLLDSSVEVHGASSHHNANLSVST